MKTSPWLLLVALLVSAGPDRILPESYESRLNPDSNNDQKITSMEIKAWFPKATQYYAETLIRQPRHVFIKFCADFDKNKNGMIDELEVKAFHERCQALANYHNDQIAKFDFNKNGKIDVGSEYSAFKGKYKNLIPGDGLSDIKGSDLELYKNRRLDDIYD